MPRPAGTCLVMLSGGIDSTVLLYERLAAGEKPVALTRATKKREVQAAQSITEPTGVPHVILDPHQEVIGILEAAKYERLNLQEHLGPNGFPHICSLADSLTFASLLHIPRVIWGWRRSEMDEREDPDRFPDYLEYISLHSYLRGCPIIEAPFFEWTKRQVLERGIALGVPLHDTFSCVKDQPEPCRTCRRCVERENAFQEILS